MTAHGPGAEVGDADYLAIQRFLHHEAALLDERDYAGWRTLLADDVVYRVTTQVVRPADEAPTRFAIIDDDAASLALRIDQLADPNLTHAENPATMTRRFLSNFQISHGPAPDSFDVTANLLVYRNRAADPAGGFLTGSRRDTLRRTEGGFRISARIVDLDETVLRDGTLSILL